MNSIARLRGVRLSKRIAKLCRYLREEAGEYYLEEKLTKYAPMIAAHLIRLEFSENDKEEYYQHLRYAMMNTVFTRKWLEITHDRGLIESRTYLSLDRELLDIIGILVRKTEKLFPQLTQ